MGSQLSPGFYLKAQNKYGGCYIARRQNHILASARNLKDLLKIIKKRKIRREGEVSIGYVPSARSFHVYLIR